MYLGHIVETGSRNDIYENCKHPYTKALLSAIPDLDPSSKREPLILSGELPSPSNPPEGCPFCTRCPEVREGCSSAIPALKSITDSHSVACHYA
jgi:peptide/nickel transport system ATP-binding protein